MWTSQSLNLGPPDYESGGIILIVPSPHRRHHTPRRLPIQTDRSRHPPTTYIYIQWCPYHGQDSKQIRNSPIKCYCLSFVTHVYLFLQRNIKSGIYAKISSTINTKKQAARSLPAHTVAPHGRRDSNSRHLVLETSALPTELHP